ncbi:MAG: maltose ABC transporter permease, partial [Candidatus Rokuibacteriota bacterium]
MGYLRRNPSLVVGIALLGALGLFMIIGHLVVDTSKSRPLSAPAVRAPSAEHPFGTDR